MTPAGRPRSEDAEQRILEATLELLEEKGIDALSMEAVARRARVGKTTIYRRWPNRGALLIAAMNHHLRTPLTITGDLRHDLLTWARDWAQTLRTSLGQGILLSFMAPDGASSDLRADIQQHRYTLMREVLDAAGATDQHDPHILNDLLGGTILYRILAWADLPDAMIETLVDASLQGSRK